MPAKQLYLQFFHSEIAHFLNVNYLSSYVSLIDRNQRLKCEMSGSHSGVAEEILSVM